MKILKHSCNHMHYKKYDKNLPIVFRRIKRLINEKISDLEFKHVGSSAAKIGGKNVIDIFAYPKLLSVKSAKKQLLDAGFQKGQKGKTRKTILLNGAVNYGDKFYDVHLHLGTKGMDECKKMIFFSDYLNKDRIFAKEYERIKKQAIAKGHTDKDSYNRMKSKLIIKIISKKRV
jgi:GrpB-like predicted nucleotidyltransferase (UPF0157 family)